MRPLEPYEGACCYRITRCPIALALTLRRVLKKKELV